MADPLLAPAPRATRLARSERRASIVAGATVAFARGGFDATSMKDLAAAAGVTPLILYRHFASKEDLYREVGGLAGARLRAAADRAPGGRFGVDARLVLDVAREDPDGFVIVWRHAVREPQFADLAAECRRYLAERVKDSLGDVVEADLVRWAAEATVGYLVHAVLTWLEFGVARHDRQFVEATDAAMRAGVRAWTRTRPHREAPGRGRR